MNKKGARRLAPVIPQSGGRRIKRVEANGDDDSMRDEDTKWRKDERGKAVGAEEN